MTKILCTIGTFAPEARSILGSITCKTMSDAELRKRIRTVEILIVGIGNLIDRKMLASATHLKLIATATTGTDHIDLIEAKNRNIRVISLKDEKKFLHSITPTAELALGLIIALARQLPSADASVKKGQWKREVFTGQSLAGKTLGIVGHGRLGSMMARYGKALGMKVLFTDPGIRGGIALDTLLRNADVISLHVHLNDTTKHMINTAALKKIKNGALLINTSRGAIVSEAAVIGALQKGILGGYAADVFEGEATFKKKAASPLITYAKHHANVILTPHIGGNTSEARSATDIFIAKKVRATVHDI